MSSRAPIGYLAIASNPIATNQGFKSFVCSEALTPDYLFYWLTFMRPRLEDMASGTTFLELSGSRAKEIPVRFPPLAEQKRIVEKVEALLAQVQAARDRLERVQQILKRFRQAVLAAGCSGELTASWRNEPGEMLSEEGDWPTPSTWEWLPLSELLDPKRKAAYGVLQPGPHVPDGVAFIRVGDLEQGTVLETSLKRIEPRIAARYPRTRLRGGELLVSLVGTIGRVAIVPPALVGANVARALAVLPLSQRVLPAFARIALSYSPKASELETLAREVARKTLNLGLLKEVRIPVPPVPEQEELVRQANELVSFARTVEARIRAVIALSTSAAPSILSKAFAGELVPTEALLARAEERNFESGEELLARLRASREPAAAARAAGRGRKARKGA